jgi:hypothetical protein
MVWIYEEPLNKNEKKAKAYLDSELRKTRYNEKILKIMDLYTYLRNKKYSSAEDVRSDIFYDKAKKRPMFNEQQSEDVFRGLYQKGGEVELKHTQKLIKSFAQYLKDNYDFLNISPLVETGIDITQMPVEFAKRNLGDGLYDLISTTVHGTVETGVSGANGVAADIAGPIGLAFVLVFTGIAASIGSILAFTEGDFAQALVHFINFFPGIGPAVVKMLSKYEKFANSVDKNRDELRTLPIVGQYVGGKRFSTRKNNKAKWPKRTRRKLIK